MNISKVTFILLATACVAGSAAAENELSSNAAGSVQNQFPAEMGAKTRLSTTAEDERKKRLILKGLDGVSHSLDEWHGKVIVLNFWASWCSPCLYEIPDFVAYQEKYKSSGLQIIGIGLDEEKKLRNVQRTLEINYPILIADLKRDNDLVEFWGNGSGIVPYSVVIDRNGHIAYTHHGLLNIETFNENVLPLLDKQ